MFPKIGVPQNRRFIMENPIKMDDLGVPLFSETPTCKHTCILYTSFYFYVYLNVFHHSGIKHVLYLIFWDTGANM